jgi:peptidyl-prolyl cis-trans isomerase D
MPQGVRPYFVQQSLAQLMLKDVLLSEADRMGLSVSNEELRETLANGAFAQVLFPDGQFVGEDAYKRIIQDRFQMPVQEFEELVKKDLTIQKLQMAVTGGVTVSDAELRKAFIEQNTKIKFDYAVITLADLEKNIKPSEAEMKAYFEKNQAQFANAVPETRKVRYLVADPAKMPNAPKVTDDDLQSYYRAHQDEFRVAESVTARHILIKANSNDPKSVDAAKVKAEDVLKQLKAGGNFAALAKKYSDDPGSKDKGGDLGSIQKGQTVPEFEQAAFAAKKGELVGPIKTMFGFHIIQVQDHTDAHLRTLAEVKDQILPLIQRQKSQAQLDTLARTLDSEAKQGIDKVAAAHGLQVMESGFISRQDTLPGAGFSPSLMDSIFTAKAGEKPTVNVTPAGVVMAQVAEIKPAGPASFDSVKDQIAASLKRQGAQMELAKKMMELSEKARAEHNLRAAAKAVGATVKTSELVRADQQIPDLGEVSRVPNILNMKPGEISGPVNAGDKGIVVAMLERQEPAEADFKSGKENVREPLLAQKKNEVLDVYVSELRARMEREKKLKVFEDRVQRFTGKMNE